MEGGGPLNSTTSLSQISLEFPYAELQVATRNFDESFRLGDGSFGGVYRGIKKDGTEIAVKVLELNEDAGFEEEVKVLSKFRHPNLVILMGFGRHEQNRFLVYELLGGGDVYKRLQKSHAEGVPFPWRLRVSVALDAACGLSHLHNSTPKVYHRDIKSPNILLDRNGTAKMADFGLACLSHTGASAHKVKQASGTIGYCCPLYVQRGLVTEGSEVYSFGIVLLELLTARQPAYMAAGPDGQQHYQFLVSYLQGDPHVTVSLADGMAQWPQGMAYAVAELSLRCIDNVEESRPAFTEIVNHLRQLRDAPDPPQAPMGVPNMQQGNRSQRPPAPGPPQPRQPSPQVIVPMQQVVVPVVQMGMQQGPPQQPQVVVAQPPPQQQPQHPAAAAAAAAAVQQQHGQQHIIQQQPQPQQQQQQMLHQQVRGSPRRTVLWILECVSVEGRNIDEEVPQGHRLLVHQSQPDAQQLLNTQRVGSLFSTDFWHAMLPKELLSVVSREHFQIWAEEEGHMPVLPSPEGNKVPCSFFLTNFCKHGTVVNGDILEVPGKQVPLHDGDTIGLARVLEGEGAIRVFMELRFDLSASALCDAGALEEASASPGAKLAVPHSKSSSSHRAPSKASQAALAPQSFAMLVGQVIPGVGTSFCGKEFRPVFALEVGGAALRDDTVPEARRIVHGYPIPAEQTGEAVTIPPLVLGRSMQPEFWQSLINAEAFNALSRQHLQIDVGPINGGGNPEEPTPGIYVTNFSEANPISLCPSDGLSKDAEAFARDVLQVEERRLLRHRTVIELNRSMENHLWLLFFDTRVERLPSAPAATQPNCLTQ